MGSETQSLLGPEPGPKEVLWSKLGLIPDQETAHWDEIGFADMLESGDFNGLQVHALAEFDKLSEAYEELTEEIRTNKSKGTREEYDRKKKKMKKLMNIWDEISPHKFVVTVSILGKDSKDYLKLLSFELNPDDWLMKGEKEWKWLKQARVERAYTVFHRKDFFPEYDRNDEESDRLTWEYPKTLFGLCTKDSSIERNLLKAPKVGHTVHWTSAKRLLFQDDVDANLRMIKALHRCGDDSESFNSLITRFLARKIWDKVMVHYAIDTILDTLFLVCLGAISVYIVFKHRLPPLALRMAVICFVVRAVFHPFLDSGMNLCKYGLKDGFNIYFTPWNIFVAFTELASAFWIGNIMLKDWSHDPSSCNYKVTDVSHNLCQFVKHPVQFSLAVGLRWITLTFELMCTPGFGRTVLPAFYAVIGKDAVWFIFFLAVIILGSYHSYWTIPIPDNMPGAGRSHIGHSFLKLFKMDILGDANMMDLEGVDEEVQLNRDGASFVGFIDDGPESRLYHDAICILMFVLVSLVAILIMNVAIGVVSEAYEYNKTNANQIWCHYRASYTTKLLMRRFFWERVCPPLKHLFSCFSDASIDAGDWDQGFYIGCHEFWFMDANDTEETLQDVIKEQHTITEVIERLEKITQKKDQETSSTRPNAGDH